MATGAPLSPAFAKTSIAFNANGTGRARPRRNAAGVGSYRRSSAAKELEANRVSQLGSQVQALLRPIVE